MYFIYIKHTIGPILSLRDLLEWYLGKPARPIVILWPAMFFFNSDEQLLTNKNKQRDGATALEYLQLTFLSSTVSNKYLDWQI